METKSFPSEYADVSAINDAFFGTFASLGYGQAAPVSICSKVDPTVRFVGSTISVLKPLLDSPPKPGVVLAQPALRTQNLSRLSDPDATLSLCSLFTALGALAPADDLMETAGHVWAFLSLLPFEANRLVIRASSRDADLVTAAESVVDKETEIELDNAPPELFRHRYGMPAIRGRNVNFAVRRGDRLIDFANIIVIERESHPIAVEFAAGAEMIVLCLRGYAHPLQASPFAGLLDLEDPHQLKLADALGAAWILLSAGALPRGRGRGRIVRGYLLAVASLTASLRMAPAELDLLVRQYGTALSEPDSRVADGICAYIATLAAAADDDPPRAYAAALQSLREHLEPLP